MQVNINYVKTHEDEHADISVVEVTGDLQSAIDMLSHNFFRSAKAMIINIRKTTDVRCNIPQITCSDGEELRINSSLPSEYEVLSGNRITVSPFSVTRMENVSGTVILDVP